MTPDPYHVAYQTALAEITEIVAKFDRLRTRKGHVENLIAALQPVFADQTGVSSPATTQATAEEESGPHLVNESAAEEQGSYSYLNVPNPLPEGDGDPFQRRAKTSLRFKGLTAQRS